MRQASIARKTGETDIAVTLDLDGSGACRAATGIGFLDHMLELLARHSLIDLEVKAKGDLHVDMHHTVEDVGITIGQALNKALSDRRGIRRYGAASIPMDEALSRVSLDISGRPHLVWKVSFSRSKIGEMDVELSARMVPGACVQLRHHFACRNALWRQQPSYCGSLL